MAGIHLHWRKQIFRPCWVLHGVAGCAGSIVATRGPADTAAWAWSVRHIAPQPTDVPDASGVAASFPEARLLASRAAFTAMQQHMASPARVPLEPPSGVLVAPR